MDFTTVHLCKKTGCKFHRVNVYAPQDLNDKIDVWNNLSSVYNSYEQEPVYFLGDFNAVRSNSERRNCEYRQADTCVFDLFIKNLNLLEVPLVKGEFTWFGPNGKRSKLDRCLVNLDWMEQGNWIVESHPRKSSDHRALVLKLEMVNWGPKPFKFFNVWLQNSVLNSKIKALLANLNANPSCRTNIQSVLKDIKAATKEWNIFHNGKIDNRIKECEKTIENLEDHGVGGKVLDDNKIELKSLYSTRAQMLKQKARIKWQLEGDRNTRFFHQAIHKRRKKNHINKIRWNNQLINQPEQTKEALFIHFSEFFKSNSESICFELGNLSISKLSLAEAHWMQESFTEEEIHFALNQPGKNKAPGPDGLTSEFLIKWWDDIKELVMGTILDFENGLGLPKGMNSAFVTLIPKKRNASEVSDFRPISVINSSFKIIDKAMANRPSSCIGNLISETQTAYIKGRQITDGILILNEIVECPKKKKCKGIILKLDFEKAYDSVNWHFLLILLYKMDFHDRWLNWIKTYLSSASTSIVVNGVPTKEFNPGRGLRQEDPLSPLLFLLVGEVLNRMIEKASSDGKIKGISLPYGGDSI